MLDSSVAEKALCDGSQALRLVVTRLPPHIGGAGGRWLTFPYEVGQNSIWVRGDCHFWIQKGEAGSLTQTLRTGVLTKELEVQLAADMRYSQLEQFADHYGDDSDLDAYFVVSDGQKAVRCKGYCTETPTAPQQLIAMEARYQEWSDRLLAMSEDVTGPMWALFTKGAAPTSPPEGDCDLSWPFSFEPSLYAQVITTDTREILTHRFENPEAQELRQWWRRNVETPNSCFPDGSVGTFLVQERDGNWHLYDLSLRDANPLENVDGLIPLPVAENQ